MTLKEKVICEAYTGICFCTGEDRNALYKYLSEKMGRPVYSHEFATNFEKIRDISREDFVKVCKGDYNETLTQKGDRDAPASLVRCEECRLHGNCVVEDAYNIARMPDSKMFCAVGKRKGGETDT